MDDLFSAAWLLHVFLQVCQLQPLSGLAEQVLLGMAKERLSSGVLVEPIVEFRFVFLRIPRSVPGLLLSNVDFLKITSPQTIHLDPFSSFWVHVQKLQWSFHLCFSFGSSSTMNVLNLQGILWLMKVCLLGRFHSRNVVRIPFLGKQRSLLYKLLRTHQRMILGNPQFTQRTRRFGGLTLGKRLVRMGNSKAVAPRNLGLPMASQMESLQLGFPSLYTLAPPETTCHQGRISYKWLGDTGGRRIIFSEGREVIVPLVISEDSCKQAQLVKNAVVLLKGLCSIRNIWGFCP